MGDLTSSPAVDTAIGLVVIWLLTAMAVSAVVELLATVFSFRAKHLWRAMLELMGDGSDSMAPGNAGLRAWRLFRSPRINSAKDVAFTKFVGQMPGVTEKSLKSVRAIDPAAAAQVIVGMVEREAQDFNGTAMFALLDRMPAEVKADLDLRRAWVERWIDGRLKALSDSYRHAIRWVAVIVSVLVVGVLGIDSVAVARQLYDDPVQRAALVAQAEDLAANPPPEACPEVDQDTDATGGGSEGDTPDLQRNAECVREALAELNGLKVSAWTEPWPDDTDDQILLVVGILATVVAAAMGSSFWYDVLARLMGLRRSSSAHEPTRS